MESRKSRAESQKEKVEKAKEAEKRAQLKPVIKPGATEPPRRVAYSRKLSLSGSHLDDLQVNLLKFVALNHTSENRKNL